MNYGIALLIFAILLWSIRNIVVAYWDWRAGNRALRKRNLERTRRQFAEARNLLMRLVVHEQVDVNSISFRFFYYINTAFMRRPDQYQEMSKVLVALFLTQHDSSASDELLAESRRWSEGFKQVVRETADALGYVVTDYSWHMRWLYKLGRRPNEPTPFHMLSAVRNRLKDQQPKPIDEIAAAQQAMYQMADGRTLARAA